MDYQILRSDRKTLCIQVRADGTVVVRAPKRCSRKYIDDFVQSKADWIVSRQAGLKRRDSLRDSFRLEEGVRITLMGEAFSVHLVPGFRPRLQKGRLILSDGDVSRQREAILRLAKAYCLPLLQQRLLYWAAIMGLSFRELHISTARTRWGSCSADGCIRISVYLLFAPPELIDYVLVHELSHRRYFNHGADFWVLVERVLPDYRERRKRLKTYGQEPLLLCLRGKG